jgi:hypothetical protein
MTLSFSDFHEIPFPDVGDIVYFLSFTKPKCEPVPFYVGQSSRHVGRFGDYVSGNFTASTDFKVGEAVKYLRQLGLPVTIRFKESVNTRIDEAELIAAFKAQGLKLLNELEGYNYRCAIREEECRRIQSFVESLVA